MFIYKSVMRVIREHQLTFIHVASLLSKGRLPIVRIASVKVVTRLFTGIFSWAMVPVRPTGGGWTQTNEREEQRDQCQELTFCIQERICLRFNRLLCELVNCKNGSHICKRCWKVDGTEEYHPSDDPAKCKNMTQDYRNGLLNRRGAGNDQQAHQQTQHPQGLPGQQAYQHLQGLPGQQANQHLQGLPGQHILQQTQHPQGLPGQQAHQQTQHPHGIPGQQAHQQTQHPHGIPGHQAHQQTQHPQGLPGQHVRQQMQHPQGLPGQHVRQQMQHPQVLPGQHVTQQMQPVDLRTRPPVPQSFRMNSDPHDDGDIGRDVLNYKYPSHMKANWQNVHATFGQTTKEMIPSVGEPNNLGDGISVQKNTVVTPQMFAESLASVPVSEKSVRPNPAEVDEGLHFRKFLEDELNRTRDQLQLERSEKRDLIQENLELRSELEKLKAREEARVMKPYRRPELVTGHKSASQRITQAKEHFPNLGYVRGPPLFNNPPDSPSRRAGSSHEDIFNLYNKPPSNNAGGPPVARERVVKETLPWGEQMAMDPNMSFGLPKIDIRDEIRKDSRKKNWTNNFFKL